MTNEEIIQNTKKSLGMGEFEPLHTFQKWKEMGFKVKKGAHSTKHAHTRNDVLKIRTHTL